MRAPNVYTISPAQPFLATVVECFLAGDLGVGPAPAGDPLALASARIYVPTQRAARALAAEFRARAAGPSVVLPRILPLGALEATEAELLFAEPDPASGLPLPEAASSIWRRLRLAELIGRWAEAIDGALCRVDAAGIATTDPGGGVPRRDLVRRRLRAGRRPCPSGRRDDHRGCGVAKPRRPADGRLRRLLAHHHRVPRDRGDALAGGARA